MAGIIISQTPNLHFQPPSKHLHALLIPIVIHIIVKKTHTVKLLAIWPGITAISLASLMESKQIYMLRCKHEALVINQKACAWEMTFITETQTPKNTNAPETNQD